MTLGELKAAVNYFDTAYDDMTVFVGDGFFGYSFIETPVDLKLNLPSNQLEMTIEIVVDDEEV